MKKILKADYNPNIKMEITGKVKDDNIPYIWIGEKECFASFTGNKKLIAFAMAILDACESSMEAK